MIPGIKNSYLSFIERPRKNILEDILFWVLAFFSYGYGAVIWFINFCYDKNIFSVYHSSKPVICLGNISWGGSGKSTLAIKIYNYLKDDFKTAILRRGYGEDEGAMLKRQSGDIYADKNRVGLVRSLEKDYDCFILDDGFQHRKLGRVCDIVVMGAREFNHPFYLIPAYIFREPLASLKRAELVVINYRSELKNPAGTIAALKKYTSAPVFTADYKITSITDSGGRAFSVQDIERFKVAAVTAIGYPQGFFNKLADHGVKAVEKIVYPDHHELSAVEAGQLAILLEKKSITHIIVTMKDKDRFNLLSGKVIIFTAAIDMTIDDEAAFWFKIKAILNK